MAGQTLRNAPNLDAIAALGESSSARTSAACVAARGTTRAQEVRSKAGLRGPRRQKGRRQAACTCTVLHVQWCATRMISCAAKTSAGVLLGDCCPLPLLSWCSHAYQTAVLWPFEYRADWEPATTSGKSMAGVPGALWRLLAVLQGPSTHNPTLVAGKTLILKNWPIFPGSCGYVVVLPHVAQVRLQTPQGHQPWIFR